MPANQSLVAYEKQFTALAPRFEALLANQLDVNKLVQSLVVSLERTPKLLECSQQSVINAAVSAAILGLSVDGVRGEAFLIPFAGKAQLVIGYKGYNTLGARAGLTITGQAVREGDAFDYDLGEGWVTHKPQLGGGNDRRIIGAWAKAAHLQRPAIVEYLSIDDILAVKAKSPGARKPDSPWNDPPVGFPAMAAKTVKRRLARSMPMHDAPQFHAAARLEEAHEEQQLSTYIEPTRGVVLEGELAEPPASTVTPSADDLIGDGGDFGSDELSKAERALLGVSNTGDMKRLEVAWYEYPLAVRKILKPQLDAKWIPNCRAKAGEQEAAA